MDVINSWTVAKTMGNYTALIDKPGDGMLDEDDCVTEELSDSPSKTGSYSSLDGSPPRMRTEYAPMIQDEDGDEDGEEQEIALSISKLQLGSSRRQWCETPALHRLACLAKAPRTSQFSHLITPCHKPDKLADKLPGKLAELTEPPHRSEEFRQWLQQATEDSASLEYLDMPLQQLAVPSALDTVLEITQQVSQQRQSYQCFLLNCTIFIRIGFDV